MAASQSQSEHPQRIVIAGAGMSGLCLAIRLKQAGIESFVILEKTDALGGTWAENTYPGAACDVPSALYSFSFAPNPDWSRKHAPQTEIRAYFEQCAERFGILPHIRFNTEITSAVYDEGDNTWRISTADGQVETCDVFVSAVGQLNRPAIPEIEGLESFRGPAFHTARWDHSFDPAGRDVAIIGTGATAIQVVPQLGPTVRRLTVFQRSPTWICRFSNYRYPGWVKKLFRRARWTERLHRYWIYLACEFRFLAFRRDSIASWIFTNWLRLRLRWELDEPLRSQLTPGFAAGCKRILLSNDFYNTLKRDNVELVTAPVERLTEDGVTTGDQTYPVDAVVLATGFQATDLITPMQVIGRGGRTLTDEWKTAGGAYLGMMNAGFPNFFMLYGPNTNLGHNSIIFMAECQVNYIVRCIQQIGRAGRTTIEVRADAVEQFTQMVQRRLKRTVWSGDCTSWYKTDSGTMINNWCGPTLEYWYRTRKPDLSVMAGPADGPQTEAAGRPESAAQTSQQPTAAGSRVGS